MSTKSPLKIYLDNCMFNRPFDTQEQIRIRLEAEAKLYIQGHIKDGHLALVWSYILDFENGQNPYDERRNVIDKWRAYASIDVEETETILQLALSLAEQRLNAKDALHVACAIEGGAAYFLTTDDKIVKRLAGNRTISAMNPTDFIKVLNSYDD